MAGIGDFDADRNIVHVGLAGPDAAARVPGAARLGHELEERAVRPHKIMGGDLRRRIAQQPMAASPVGKPV